VVEMVLRTEELMTPHPMAQMIRHPMALMETITEALMETITEALMETITEAQMEVLMVQMITTQTSNFSSLEPQPLNKETTCITMLTLIVYIILTTQK
jgi:hypothetical protein